MTEERRSFSARKTVAIAVPTSTRSTLTADEQISLRHLLRHLGHHDRYLVRPQSVPIELPDFGQRVFGDEYFGSARAHKQLMLSRNFYESFADYEYVLVYHLDAAVFSDQLLYWCEQGYDFIGAPWLKCWERPEEGFSRVGNGGFSLRRVPGMLRLLGSPRRAIAPARYWNKYFADKPWYIRWLNRPRWLAKHFRMFNNLQRELAAYGRAEPFGDDQFLGYRAEHYDPEFKIAPPEVAVRFAFNTAPRYCYTQTCEQLPFGCHAWDKNDREFWEPFLLT
jgi:hypothetical protein